jgi:tRNA pseudouridine13 synthase
VPNDFSLTVPPITTEDLPETGGAIGPEPEDFQVDEIPLYAFSGEGEHLYVRLRKRLFTTRDAVTALARASGVPQSEIGTAGMKDKHAVTTQWMSLPARRAKPLEGWELPEGLSVVESTRHGNKLRTGHLKGNEFRIRLAGVSQDAASRAEAIVLRLRENGLPNYFGAQRFGRDGDNVAQASAWIEAEARGERPRVAAFERKLYASVLQAEVFNRYVTARVAEGLARPLLGEVVRLEGTGSMFAVEDAEREAPRWESNDIHPTGPMIGPKTRKAHGRALDLEQAAVEGVGLSPEALEKLARFADGTRRDLLLWLDDIRVEEEQGNPAGETSPGASSENHDHALVVVMSLPSGSYATQVMREFSREPFFRYSR